MASIAPSVSVSTVTPEETGHKPVYKRLWVKVVAAVLLCLLAAVTLLEIAEMAKLPELPPLARVATIPHSRKLDSDHIDQRLLLIGDVHGMSKELRKLLRKVNYDSKKDTVVFLGDMITKGYDSQGVVDFAIKNNAYCVRGNHEDEILSLYAERHHLAMPMTYPPYASPTPMTAFELATPTLAATFGPDLRDKAVVHPQATGAADTKDKRDESGFAFDDDNDDDYDDNHDDFAFEHEGEFDDEHYDDSEEPAYPMGNAERDGPLVKALKPRHIAYLASCPAILQLGQVSRQGIEAVGVHGGLLWHEHDLENQKIEDVLRIRSLQPPDYKLGSEDPDDGKPWFPLWNEEQVTRPKNERFEVFYGHDASKGLQLDRYSKGLDTKCQRGGKLSAYVVRVKHNGRVKEDLVQIDC